MRSARDTVVQFYRWFGNFEKMVELCQKSWADDLVDEPEKRLKDIFGPLEKINVKVGKPVPKSAVWVNVPVDFVYRHEGKEKNVKLIASVICETAPYKPSVNGEWGINPTSLLRDWQGLRKQGLKDGKTRQKK